MRWVQLPLLDPLGIKLPLNEDLYMAILENLADQMLACHERSKNSKGKVFKTFNRLLTNLKIRSLFGNELADGFGS